MAPNLTSFTRNFHDNDEINIEKKSQVKTGKNLPDKFVKKIVWVNVIIFSLLHIFSVYGLYLVFTSAKIMTTLFACLLYILSGFGITAGAHRLWAHKTYEANFPLRVVLMLLNSMAFQGSIWWWTRDHRVHHKFTDTNIDPYNSKRGFFFSHVGWLLIKKHPDVETKGQAVSMRDIEADPIVTLQHKYYYVIMPIMAILMPTLIPVYFWNEKWINGLFVSTFLRYVIVLNMTSLVNSAAHAFGSKPYDNFISPGENAVVSVATLGEGWHNYHHTFPWDYKTSELPGYGFNWTTGFIDFFSKIGWAYNLKTVSPEIIKARCERTGDGTHMKFGAGVTRTRLPMNEKKPL